jgi:hypothetical protein
MSKDVIKNKSCVRVIEKDPASKRKRRDKEKEFRIVIQSAADEKVPQVFSGSLGMIVAESICFRAGCCVLALSDTVLVVEGSLVRFSPSQ